MLQIDKKKALKKWSPILESLGVKDDQKLDWMSEYAEFHSLNESYSTGVGFSALSNLTGMGAVTSPVASTVPGGIGSYTMGQHGAGIAGFGQNAAGSGDYGQQLLPVAMKIAAQTIGLDLVAVKPSPGPVIDLMYVDYRYDDGPLGDPNYNPVTFKLDADDLTALKADIDAALLATGAIEQVGGLNKRIFFNLAANAAANGGAGRAAGTVGADYAEVSNKEGVIEFLGYSRIDGKPMFRIFRTTNAAAWGSWRFDQTKNSLGEDETLVEALQAASGAASSAGDLFISDLVNVKIELISALEDHIPGFAGGFNRNGAMNRLADEQTYPGVIAPNVSTKRVTVGTIEVSSALKRTEIEDIKSQTGIDIVQKLESVLVNELSQTISKEIVYKLFELGELNRTSAPTNSSVPAPYNTVFDFDVDAYFAGGGAPGGETSNSAQRKLLTRIDAASNYIATEGRIGPAQYMVTNAKLAAVLKTAAGYTINPVKSSMNPNGQLYPVGSVGDITLYVDPYQKYNDDRILLGRKNNPDQPGVIFVPYLMAQSISLISEATFAPRMLLRSRYAVVDVGFFPQKQYMTMRVKDTGGYLS